MTADVMMVRGKEALVLECNNPRCGAFTYQHDPTPVNYVAPNWTAVVPRGYTTYHREHLCPQCSAAYQGTG